jgi:D-inositol-3-phosphate glycosyltransferase
MTPAPLHIAMISVHSSPLGPLGTQDTGGMSVYIRELSRELGRMGHRVDIFTGAGGPADGPGTERLHSNVRLVHLSLGPGGQAPKAELHTRLAHFARALNGFCDRSGADYDLVHSHYWLSGCVGEMLRSDRKRPHVTTFHTLAALKNEVLGQRTDPAIRVAAERELAAACDRVVVTSLRERSNLLRYYDADAARVRVVPCGVDPVLFSPLGRHAARQRIGVGDDERLVLYVGRFAPEKGLERLLRAIAAMPALPRLRLVVVGGEGDADPQTGRMRAVAQSLGVGDRVAFAGRVEHPELPAYYSAADALALPSAYESFGMVGLEALACGTPVAATRVGAMDELITTGRNGSIADGFTPEALAQAIGQTLALPSAVSDDARARIRRTALRYSWAAVARELLQVYQSAMPALGHPLDDGRTQPALAVHAGGVG